MDMLIKLYNLPTASSVGIPSEAEPIVVRRAMAFERTQIITWVQKSFSPGWADECAVAFGHLPVGCYIAICLDRLIGFCCLNTPFRNYVGPVGVMEDYRHRGVGRRLILASLDELRHLGYAYAVAGDVGQPGFFRAAVGAIEIPESSPGSYPTRLQTS